MATLTVTEQSPQRTHAVFAGTLCTQTVRDLRTEIIDLSNSVRTDLTIDLSEVSFIDGRGLSMLVQLRQALGARGLDCSVVAVSPIVGRLLQLTKLECLMADMSGDGAPRSADHA